MNLKYIAIGIGVVVIVGGVGLYLFLNNQTVVPANETPKNEQAMEEGAEESMSVQQEQAEAVEVDISEWKTYRDQKFGFEIKYPVCGDEPRFLETSGEYKFLYMVPLSILIYNSEGMELAEFVESRYSDASPGENIGTPEPYIVNSHEFLKVDSSYQVGTNQIDSTSFAKHRESIIEFHYRVWPLAACESSELAEKMLDTIVFFD